ncbi:methylglyoxal reductase (NADPH-dependent) gre2 [Ascochyta clinopodiicola]|nr:methylglyoxal reductase (NADPH-dependent) gre2 [Ascochyta clinopodiicola]
MSQTTKGKTAIVTGAGICLSFARLLLDGGANVILADLQLREEAQSLVNTYTSGRPRAIFKKTNVRQWDQLTALFDLAMQEFGGVDIVCPGAGVYEPEFSNFWIPPGQTPSIDSLNTGRYASLDINLTHPIRLTQLAIFHFAAASPPASLTNRKSIILISSTAGQKTPLAAPIYCASKHAINGFVRSLAPLQDKVGIRVAAVAPGVVKTPLWTEHAEKSQAIEEGKDQWVTPELVAEVMMALVSRDSTTQNPDQSAGDVFATTVPIVGGSILEVTTEHVRNVAAVNDPGPAGRPGSTVSNMRALEDRVWEALSGHTVVTTVRSRAKGDQIMKRFADIRLERLSYVIVEDIAVYGAFDHAVVSNPPFDAVLHTASPFHFDIVDAQRDLLDPAIVGTTGILRAIKLHAPEVKRVVITSSFASIINPKQHPAVYDETVWNPVTWEEALADPTTAYRGSKTFAEQAAWRFHNTEQPNFSLSTVNPPSVFGPITHHLLSQSRINTSNARIRDMIEGKMKERLDPTGTFLWVDVRDVALAHVKAAELPEAAGKRLFITAGHFSNADLASIIREEFPEYAKRLPNKVESDQPSDVYGFNNKATNDILRIHCRALRQCVVDTIRSLQFAEA